MLFDESFYVFDMETLEIIRDKNTESEMKKNIADFYPKKPSQLDRGQNLQLRRVLLSTHSKPVELGYLGWTQQ